MKTLKIAAFAALGAQVVYNAYCIAKNAHILNDVQATLNLDPNRPIAGVIENSKKWAAGK